MNASNDLQLTTRKNRGVARRLRGAVTLSLLLATAAASQALPIVLTPAMATFSGMNNGTLSVAAVQAVTGATSLTIAYKQNVGGGEEGGFAGSYSTIFSNTLNNPSDALLQFSGAPNPFITGGSIYLYVKDGTPRPWYLFDITSWNGRDALQLNGFYLGPGSISQITIYTGPKGGPTPTPPPQNVPEGGSTVALLGAAICAVDVLRRKLHR